MEKTIYILVVMLITFTSCKAQQVVSFDSFNTSDNAGKYFKDLNNKFDNFIGTWEYTQGNETFRMVLSKTLQKPYGSPVEYWRDIIEGKFYLIENVGTFNENIICQSEKYFPQSGYTTTYVIHAGTVDGVKLGGSIQDTCNQNENFIGLTSHIEMEIINPTATTLQANWKVYRKGMGIVGYTYSFPNNIILTKQ